MRRSNRRWLRPEPFSIALAVALLAATGCVSSGAHQEVVDDRDRLQRTARLRIYLRKHVYLSTILPILDNFGLQIVDQNAVRVQVAQGLFDAQAERCWVKPAVVLRVGHGNLDDMMEVGTFGVVFQDPLHHPAGPILVT